MKYFLFILLSLTLACCRGGGERLYEVVACGDDRVIIIDAAAPDGDSVKIVWEWCVSEAAGQVPEAYRKYLNTINECKPIHNGTQLLLTASRAVLLLERATKKCLFYAYVPNSHSAALLPGGRVAVALSENAEGNSVELYDIRRPKQVLFRDSLYSGHGAVWIEKRDLLYVLGYDELRAYALKDWDTSAPGLTLVQTWILPLEGGHDLSLVSEDELLVSAHDGVCSFDLSAGTFTPFEPLRSTPHVKAVNYNPKTSELVYTKGEESWWTHHIYFENPNKVLTIPRIRLYKARPIHR